MFSKFLILLFKDVLLVIRDKAGMGFLFVMPVTLVFIMTILQENAYRTLRNNNLELIVQNNDNDSLGNFIVQQLKTSGVFKIDIKDDNPKINIEGQVAKGRYKVGIIVPDSLTYFTGKLIDQSLEAAFNGEDSVRSDITPPDIEIFFDPVIRASYMLMIKSMLKEINSSFRNKLLIKELNDRIPFLESELKIDNIVSIREKFASGGKYSVIPNSVQHNIPAWMLFAMFFIVTSLAGNMVKEREDGSFKRLQFMHLPYGIYISSKVTAYLLVCLVQFILMLLTGIYVMPLIGFPALSVGDGLIPLLLIGLTSAMAAAGFGIFTGTIAGTYQQAAAFGALSVLILAAIGGIWVPVFMMPDFMQVVSKLSPMNWGIEGFYNVLVRNLPLEDSLDEMSLLILFFVITMGVSVIIYSYRKKHSS